MSEANPLETFKCSICGENAPKRLRQHGKFEERMSWLRHHYKQKHPGHWPWGKNTNPQGFVCPICRYTPDPRDYPSWDQKKRAMVDHLVKRHPEFVKSKMGDYAIKALNPKFKYDYNCAMCNYGTNSRNLFINHLVKDHGVLQIHAERSVPVVRKRKRW